MVLPATYRAAEFQEKGGKLVFVEKTLVLPSTGEILLKTISCGICHSDGATKNALFGTGFPKVAGHEFIGKVVAVPDSETKWKVGDRVGAGWHGGHDGTCDQCLEGHFPQCKNVEVNGVGREGGFAEYVLVRREALAAVPETLDPAMAGPLLCAGVTVFRPIADLAKGLKPGSIVAVQGLGGLGHLAVQFLSKMGFAVVALSRGDDKKQLAKELGATHYLAGSPQEQAEALKSLGGAHIVVVTGTDSKAVAPLLQGMAIRGTMIIVGVFEDGALPLDAWTLTNKDLTIRGSWIGGPGDMEATLKFAADTGVETYVQEFSFDDINAGWEAMETGKARFRAVVRF